MNAADEQQLADSKKRNKAGRDQELDDLRTVLGTPQGRRFYWRTLGECGIYRTSYTGSSNSTCFNEGKREIGLRLMADLMEAAPEKYILMQQEATAKHG